MKAGTPIVVDTPEGFYSEWDKFLDENEHYIKTQNNGWIDKDLVFVPLGVEDGSRMTSAEQAALTTDLHRRRIHLNWKTGKLYVLD